MKLHNTEFEYAVRDMIEMLREMDDGAVTSTARLLEAAGYDESELKPYDMYDLNTALFANAEANGITLDMSEHEYKLEGLPYILTFVVHNKEGQPVCPHCGSTDTARILYGMPAMDDELDRKIEAGKITLGGCIIHVDENGNAISPDRKCNECNKEFMSEPLKLTFKMEKRL